MTPHGHLVSVTKQINYCARYKDAKRLEAYVQSAAFVQGLAAIPPEHRKKVMMRYHQALEICTTGAKLPPKTTYQRLQWTPLNIARFRKAYAAGGLDGAAHALGLSIEAARLASKRYAKGAHATLQGVVAA